MCTNRSGRTLPIFYLAADSPFPLALQIVHQGVGRERFGGAQVGELHILYTSHGYCTVGVIVVGDASRSVDVTGTYNSVGPVRTNEPLPYTP